MTDHIFYSVQVTHILLPSGPAVSRCVSEIFSWQITGKMRRDEECVVDG